MTFASIYTIFTNTKSSQQFLRNSTMQQQQAQLQQQAQQRMGRTAHTVLGQRRRALRLPRRAEHGQLEQQPAVRGRQPPRERPKRCSYVRSPGSSALSRLLGPQRGLLPGLGRRRTLPSRVLPWGRPGWSRWRGRRRKQSIEKFEINRNLKEKKLLVDRSLVPPESKKL